MLLGVVVEAGTTVAFQRFVDSYMDMQGMARNGSRAGRKDWVNMASLWAEGPVAVLCLVSTWYSADFKLWHSVQLIIQACEKFPSSKFQEHQSHYLKFCSLSTDFIFLCHYNLINTTATLVQHFTRNYIFWSLIYLGRGQFVSAVLDHWEYWIIVREQYSLN